MSFEETAETVGKAIDGAGIAVIVIGILAATAIFLRRLTGKDDRSEAYTQYRQGIGRAILLGLELLVAADIIKTVAVSPTFRSAGVLAIIVAIRTFLSVTLQHELEGRGMFSRGPARSQAAEA
ncbi:MAG: DUF1622 domain-containing protein [Actinomycetota bacterium]|nr:DUF1622 domain-containing protein [Actinomycetota bacterium]